MDQEIQAISQILEALRALDTQSQTRVVEYINKRYATKTLAASANVTNAPKAVAKETPKATTPKASPVATKQSTPQDSRAASQMAQETNTNTDFAVIKHQIPKAILDTFAKYPQVGRNFLIKNCQLPASSVDLALQRLVASKAITRVKLGVYAPAMAITA